MVRPSGRRGDDDLGPVTDRTGRVEGRTVTPSSRGVRGRHSTSDLPGEADERGDDDGDGGDDDHDEGDDDGDEEQTVYVAPVAPASGSDGRPRHGKGKVLTGSFIPEVARDVQAPTQKRKKVKASDWEQTGATEGGPVDPELIPSYSGHVASLIWH
ncbi:hypothetical protein M9H77_20707 [Catharanthus roseus]|uniref:Uncharacterized protein n=1 Tax=Catharanthus roseus TaxID=4058 RepID=A0ACC0ALD8_CATRO|nr:hypothetical protein M9H77_20707 [Catharanthus roseus]